jgi:hypothetical protein
MQRYWQRPHIWLAFALIFIALAAYHFYLTTQSVPSFKIVPRPLTQVPGLQLNLQFAGADLDQPIRDFVAEFNAYVVNQNVSSRTTNLVSGWGYVLAFLTAVLSFFREISAVKTIGDNISDRTCRHDCSEGAPRPPDQNSDEAAEPPDDGNKENSIKPVSGEKIAKHDDTRGLSM